MSYISGEDRRQPMLLPDSVEQYVGAEHPVRIVDAFVDGLDLRALGFGKSVPAATGRPPYHPGDLLKLYLWGYLNRVTSSRRLERECARNLELFWLLRRLQPDFTSFPSSSLGTHLSPKLRFVRFRTEETRLCSPTAAKLSFGDNGIPKLELGNEGA